MPRPAASLLLLLSLCAAGGCSNKTGVARPEEFGPAKLRIHPSFTQVKDVTGGTGKPNGIEVVVELLDGYGEPTRGSGTLIFELWSFRKFDPDPLGNRVAGPWRGPILTREEQAEHWSPALRAYSFPIAFDKVNPTREYVLTGSFETAGGADKPGGTRLFDRLIIEPRPEKKAPGNGVRGTGGRAP